jgi:hypothetical protein
MCSNEEYFFGNGMSKLDKEIITFIRDIFVSLIS